MNPLLFFGSFACYFLVEDTQKVVVLRDLAKISRKQDVGEATQSFSMFHCKKLEGKMKEGQQRGNAKNCKKNNQYLPSGIALISQMSSRRQDGSSNSKSDVDALCLGVAPPQILSLINIKNTK